MDFLEKLDFFIERRRPIQYIADDIANEVSDQIYEVGDAEENGLVPEGTTAKIIESITKEMARLKKYGY